MDQFVQLRAIAKLLADFSCLWGFCGGWAIDLFLRRATRPHPDIDVAFLRRDQFMLHSYLERRGWELHKVVNGKPLPWPADEFVELPVHEIRCTNPEFSPDAFEALLNEAEGDDLLFRRDPAVKLPLRKAFIRSESGLPILAPEVVLLYKAKYHSHEENITDFRNTLPHFDPARLAWLQQALRRHSPGHIWLSQM